LSDEPNESTTRIVVGPNDAVPAILSRLRAGRAASATITIPASSSLFLTASEFRALKATAEQARRILTVETDDRLRKQLAEMFGLPVVDLTEEPRPVAGKTSVVNLETGRGVLESADGVDGETNPVVRAAGRPRPSRGFSQGKLIGIIGAVIALLAVAALVVAYLLQTATIEITAKRAPVTANLTFAIAQPGVNAPAGSAFTLQARSVTLNVPFTAKAATTGRARTPGATAAGKVELRNTSTSDIAIAAGTSFTSFDGVQYFFPNAVTVPAMDKKTNAPGQATAQVSASAGGKSGNKDVGLLTGKLDSGVYYSNRDNPIEGGSDSAAQGVSQADIDGLVAQANQKLPQLAASQDAGNGLTVLPGSVKSGQLNYTVDHKVGDDAKELTINASMSVTALAYSANDLKSAAMASAQNALASQVPSGYQLVPESVNVGEPATANGQYSVAVKADARATISDARAKEIAKAVAGKSVSDAKAFLGTLPEVQSVDISSSPGFLPARIPSNASKITVKTE
jgi:hypothetical protein